MNRLKDNFFEFRGLIWISTRRYCLSLTFSWEIVPQRWRRRQYLVASVVLLLVLYIHGLQFALKFLKLWIKLTLLIRILLNFFFNFRLLFWLDFPYGSSFRCLWVMGKRQLVFVALIDVCSHVFADFFETILCLWKLTFDCDGLEKCEKFVGTVFNHEITNQWNQHLWFELIGSLFMNIYGYNILLDL